MNSMLVGVRGWQVPSGPVAAVLAELRPVVVRELTELLALPAPTERLTRLIDSYFKKESRDHPHGTAKVLKRCPFGAGGRGQTEHEPTAVAELKAYVAETRLEDLRVGTESKEAVRSRLLTQVGIAARRLYRSYSSSATRDLTDEQDRRSASLLVERLMKNSTVRGVQVATARSAAARFVLTGPQLPEELSQ